MMKTLSTVLRMFLLWTVIRWVMSRNSGGSPAAGPVVTSTTADGRTVTSQSALPPVQAAWIPHTHFDLHVYVNEQPDFDASSLFSDPSQLLSSSLPYLRQHLLWREEDVEYEEESWSSPAIRSLNVSLTEPFLSQAVHNASLYAHVYFSRRGYPHAQGLDCEALSAQPQLQGLVSRCWQRWDPLAAMHVVQQLNVFRPPRKVDKRKNLITGETADAQPAALPAADLNGHGGSEDSVASSPSSVWVSHWKPTLHIRLVHDFSSYPSASALPVELADGYSIDPATGRYTPIVYIDYWWQLSSHLLAVNSTLSSLPLLLTYSPISMLKYRMERSMDASWRLQQSLGTHSEEDTESMKRIMLESNPYLLAVTMAVSLLHMLFDFLAFKNDIQFWRSNKSTAGLSGRSVLLNTGCQAVVFLYLLDNDTSWMILVSAGIGLLIECWKIPKLFSVQLSPAWPFLLLEAKQVATDAQGRGVTEQDQLQLLTNQYDKEAMRYLSYLLYPLVLCYACYSLLYNTHRGWYSFTVTSLVSCIYLFGFINMCPQLYLNWKLKSVAAMPWRQMTYKFLNTVIDDLFAFVIAMPALHRLSVFRDDLIFLIFLYQRWIYRTDANRTNEFGVSGKDMESMEREKRKREDEERRRKEADSMGVGVQREARALVEERKEELRQDAETVQAADESVPADSVEAEATAAAALRQRKITPAAATG